ncbi:MAG: SPOR domain-containing protein [Ideonella sp.]|nr:SPOR domain-containing protein [Ideonella sp.]
MHIPQTSAVSRRTALAPAHAWGPRAQSGGFFLGAIVGLLVGLAIALAVALYIAKVPVPFIDKVPHRSAEQQQEEAERLKNWDPNAGLGGKPVQRPAGLRDPAASAASAPTATAKAAPAPQAPEAPAAAASPAKAASRPAAASAPAKPERDPGALLAGQGVPGDKPAASAPKAEGGFIYFVQAGAFSSADDAEQQRAKLAMAGVTARVTEREQNGRVVHRVRVGPLDSREDAATVQEKLKAVGAEAALVRIEKPVKP